jgi:hypothetical protein
VGYGKAQLLGNLSGGQFIYDELQNLFLAMGKWRHSGYGIDLYKALQNHPVIIYEQYFDSISSVHL